MADLILRSQDATPPLAAPVVGGTDVAAGAEVQLIAANAGRVKVTVCHAGTAGTLWLGLDATATANVGLYLSPGDVFEEFFAGAVRVRNTGTGTVRVTWVEWAA